MPNTSKVKKAVEWIAFSGRLRAFVPLAVQAVREGKPLMLIHGPIGKRPERPKGQ
jgi:hypothetical protein